MVASRIPAMHDQVFGIGGVDPQLDRLQTGVTLGSASSNSETLAVTGWNGFPIFGIMRSRIVFCSLFTFNAHAYLRAFIYLDRPRSGMLQRSETDIQRKFNTNPLTGWDGCMWQLIDVLNKPTHFCIHYIRSRTGDLTRLHQHFYVRDLHLP
jgi:hypothetical protein